MVILSFKQIFKLLLKLCLKPPPNKLWALWVSKNDFDDFDNFCDYDENDHTEVYDDFNDDDNQ